MNVLQIRGEGDEGVDEACVVTSWEIYLLFEVLRVNILLKSHCIERNSGKGKSEEKDADKADDSEDDKDVAEELLHCFLIL